MKKRGYGVSERCGYINIIFSKFDLDGEEKAKKGDHCVWSRKKASSKKRSGFLLVGLHLKQEEGKSEKKKWKMIYSGASDHLEVCIGRLSGRRKIIQI